MTSQPGQQVISIQTLPNTSRSKENQTMKFGQLVEYNERNISIYMFQYISIALHLDIQQKQTV